MTIATFIWWRRLASAACILVVVTTAPMSGIAVAQKGAPADGAKKAAKSPDSGMGKHGSLTVEVLLVDPDKKKEQHPIANAIVRIEGAENSQETNEKGRAKLSGIPTGKVALQIMAAGLGICRLRDVSVKGGDQVVSVLLEKSQKGKCTRRE